MDQALEHLIEDAPPLQSLSVYATIDTYAAGTVALYSGPAPRMPDYGIAPLGGPDSPGAVRGWPDYLEGGEERFRAPEQDRRHGYHMNYETLIPGIRKPIVNIHLPMDDDYLPMDDDR